MSCHGHLQEHAVKQAEINKTCDGTQEKCLIKWYYESCDLCDVAYTEPTEEQE